MRKSFFVLLLVTAPLLWQSCKMLNPNQMLRTGKNYHFNEFTDEDKQVKEYKLAPDDKISFFLYTNEGQKLIDPINKQNTQQRNIANSFEYTIEVDGKINLPQIGRVKLAGKTIKEAEFFLEDAYSSYYNEPFAIIEVTNKRVIVFPGGEGGTAQVVQLKNANTTIFEALAEAGGIKDGKAHKVKLIRGNLKEPKVYLIDLSTIEGVKEADMVVQANDIIYVQPRSRVPEKIVKEIAPYLSLLTATLLVINLFN